MKIRALFEDETWSSRRELLEVQSHLIEGLPDDWNVELDENGIVLKHPDMPGHVLFGPVDYADIDGDTSLRLERNTVKFYREAKVQVISVSCRNVKAASLTVRLKSLTDAFKAICAYSGADSIAELARNPAMLDDICGYLTEDVRPHVET